MNGIDQAGSQSVPVSSSSGIVSSTGVTKSSTTVAFWQRQLGLAQVTKLRGNCWRKHGFCINITNFFYPEEALLLYERGFLVVTKTPNGSDCMTKQELYEAVLEVISLSCYLTYARLKSLDYIVFRHKKSIRVFQDAEDLKQCIRENPALSLLDIMISFDVYIEEEGFSKRVVREKTPLAHVTIMESEQNFPPRVLLKLVDEAEGTPVFVSAVTKTGFVIVEEYTDAEKSLEMQNSKRNLKKIYGRPCMGKYVDLDKFGGDDEEEEQPPINFENHHIGDDDHVAIDDGAADFGGDHDISETEEIMMTGSDL